MSSGFSSSTRLVEMKHGPEPNVVAAESPILRNFELVVTRAALLRPLTVTVGIWVCTEFLAPVKRQRLVVSVRVTPLVVLERPTESVAEPESAVPELLETCW